MHGMPLLTWLLGNGPQKDTPQKGSLHEPEYKHMLSHGCITLVISSIRSQKDHMPSLSQGNRPTILGSTMSVCGPLRFQISVFILIKQALKTTYCGWCCREG